MDLVGVGCQWLCPSFRSFLEHTSSYSGFFCSFGRKVLSYSFFFWGAGTVSLSRPFVVTEEFNFLEVLGWLSTLKIACRRAIWPCGVLGLGAKEGAGHLCRSEFRCLGGRISQPQPPPIIQRLPEPRRGSETNGSLWVGF